MKSISILLILAAVYLSSCERYLDPGSPATELTSKVVFQNDATATSALLAIYTKMESDAFAYFLIQVTGLSSDELADYSGLPDNIDIATNNINPANAQSYLLWEMMYRYIYQANAVIEGVENSASLTTNVRGQLKGEALFIRAFCHFYLTQLYGKIPLVLTSSYTSNAVIKRASEESVVMAIEADLLAATSLLSSSYMNGVNQPGSERVRPNSCAAKALLAKLKIATREYNSAETLATEVINDPRYQMVNEPSNVFLTNSTEAIWQWMSVVPQYDSFSGSFFILFTTPYDVALQNSIAQIWTTGDKRKTAWIAEFDDGFATYLYPSKYKVMQTVGVVSEYTMIMRLAEQYLLRAEARCQQDKLSLAEYDLNVIRRRAGIQEVNGLSKAALMDSIALERKRELFCEFGDRWTYLRRSGRADAVLSAVKGAGWQTTDQLYPVPQLERLRNPNLDQNPGY